MRPFGLFAIGLLAVAAGAAAQGTSAPQQIFIKAGRLIDGRADAPQTAVGILIEGERIKAVAPAAQLQAQAHAAKVIDLSTFTVLPGLIEIGRAHV